MFIDRIKVFAQAGKGGRGCVSFRREKFVPKGGPDGGDGGRGGNVILRADRHVDNLTNLFYEPIIKAKNGGHGKGKKMTGRAGADKIVKVPAGTIVYAAEGGERSTFNAQRSTSNSEQSAIPVIDLTRSGEEFVLCRGGAGGKGNVHFKSSRNRAPRQYTEGERKISAARPKVAAYPFTTLHPIVGVIEFPGYQRATIADIPGLIEGAHRGLGLGHEFLRHITRCRVLVFVIDVAGSEGRNPVEDLQNLRREIDLYDPALSSRPWFIVANKMDLPDAKKNLKAVQERFPRIKILPTSAAIGEGMDALKKTLAAEFMRDKDIVAEGI